MTRFFHTVATVTAILLTVFSTHCKAADTDVFPGPIIVGTKEAPPFSMKTDTGQWTGISIELWRQIAEKIGTDYEFKEFDLKNLLEAVEKDNIGVGVAALTITAKREKLFDFTHPFHTAGLGIAVAQRDKSFVFMVFDRLLSLAFLKAVSTLAVMLLCVGFIVWLFERKKNPDDFGGKFLKGIGASFWWSAVTMTTVGYGDKAPVTVGGRIVAIVWMFAAIIMISSFTAAIASSLTVKKLEAVISGPSDLPKVSVGAIAETTGENYLTDRHISHTSFATPQEGLLALSEGKIDALVHDAPILKYNILMDYNGRLDVLPKIFNRQHYAFAVPAGSPLREIINRKMLEIIYEEPWQRVLHKYLGMD